ncbi:MAG: nucleotidyltransferase domain-containing protein, partial [Candidatus Aureabacteria bacterium]|nr:nucleotidyltransferase domain-containing protein [Candidatus Auribacterota bacterium]
LEAEHKQFILMQEDLAGIMEGHCLSGLLFGSAARGEDDQASDFDLALIVEKRDRQLPEIVRALVHRGMGKWGIRVSPIVLTRAEFIAGVGRGEPLAAAILKEGIAMCGKSPRSLVR